MKVKCIIKDINIYGTEISFKEKLWIDDKNHDEGGSYQFVNMLYPEPMIRINFIGQVDIKLIIGANYSDKDNYFRAIEENVITLTRTVVKSFSIPTELVLVSKSVIP